MSSFCLTRRGALTALGAAALVGGAGSLAVLLPRPSGERVKHRRRDASYRARVPSASPDWVSRVRELHAHIGQGDFAGAAKSAGYLTDAAFTAADQVVQAWLAERKTYRGFLPRKIERGTVQVWNYRDCAADLYCHLVIEASLIAPAHLTALRDLLAKERAIASGLPQAIRLDSGERVGETLEERIFGAVEYAKDGLLPILERIGPTEWLDRLHEVVDAIIAASPVETRFGRLPSDTTEKNGEFLQVLARLYQRERRPEYLAAGRAIADAYTQEILPLGGGIPAGDFRLRDHGNEVVSGLAEWVMAEAGAPGSRAEQYRPEVERIMDMLLDRGRDAAGLWGDQVLPEGEAPPPSPAQPVNDNWGYLTASYVGYALSLPELSQRRRHYLAESRRAFAGAIAYRSAAWEKGRMDGYADTIEGAQYLLPFLKVEGAARWIDDETGILLAYQKPDGFAGKMYADGNFVRTSLLYALFRTQGSRLDPWRPGVRLGAVTSTDGLHLALSSDSAWKGRIIFDRKRHREYLNLPYEYPRLNGWPEWFTVDPDAGYEITRNREGKEPETKVIAGSELLDGLVVGEPAEGPALHIQLRPKT